MSSDSTILKCPDFSLPFNLYTDACDYGIGAVLAQETPDGEVVIAYASRLLKSSEKKYAVLQKEALGIVWSLKHFYPYLYGRHFTIITDHRPLKWLRTMTAPNNLFACWLSEIQSYDFEVRHRPGRLHSNADTLSRYPFKGEDKPELVPSDAVMTVSKEDFAAIQENDLYAGALMKFLKKGETPVEQKLAATLKKDNGNFFLGTDGCVYRRFHSKRGRISKQFVVPKSMVGKLLIHSHDSPMSSHPGFYRMYKKIQQSYFWPTMKTDIKRHVRHCDECAKYRTSSKPAHKTPMKSVVTERPLQIVAMDFVGPLPKSDA